MDAAGGDHGLPVVDYAKGVLCLCGTSLDASDTTVAARFRVGAVLGKGAYGTVWRAECRLTGAPAPSPSPGRSKSQLAADALTCSLARALGGARLEASQSH